MRAANAEYACDTFPVGTEPYGPASNDLSHAHLSAIVNA
jgi:hypothetical protein